MACPAATAEPRESWLDRLRSARGFPPHHAGLDLDHFLLLPNPNPTPSPSPPPEDPPLGGENPLLTPQREEAAAPGGGEGRKWFDLVSSALAELFHMGDPRELRAARAPRKSSRKQPNPRICVASAPASNASSCPAGEQGGGLLAMSPPSAENSTAGGRKWPDGRTKARRRKRARAPCSSAGDSSDLSAYSRTEVTVIDTSYPARKSQKIIFRKGSVWKVRDKKTNVCKKKRRLGVVKRLASEKEQEELLSEGRKEALGKEHLASSTGCFIRNDRRDVSKDISRTQSQIPERRVQLSRSSRGPVAKDSSLSCL